jgi:predicted peptidase
MAGLLARILPYSHDRQTRAATLAIVAEIANGYDASNRSQEQSTMWRIVFLAVPLGVLCMFANASSADDRDRFEARAFEDPSGGKLLYRLLKPKDYSPSVKYPLVLFLHGAGERGDDNQAQLIHGMRDYASDALMQKFPCFVVAPQCPKGKQWVDVAFGSLKHDMPEQPADALRRTMDAVAALEKEFSIDPDRLYITGLSMGGYGTWDALQRYPDRFAAAVPICGGGDTKLAKRIIHVPIWAFHGDKDQAVPPERSRQMIEALREAGGTPKYTEYQNVGHDSWTATYKDLAMHEWMFAQKRSRNGK